MAGASGRDLATQVLECPWLSHCGYTFTLVVLEKPHNLPAGSVLESSRHNNKAGVGSFSKERRKESCSGCREEESLFSAFCPSVYPSMPIFPFFHRQPIHSPPLTIHPSVHLSMPIFPSMPFFPSFHRPSIYPPVHLPTDHPSTIRPSSLH